jgi:dTDP-4-amino-4,6-dideoxygalactose transaminase
MEVPFLDLKKQYASISGDITRAMGQVIEQTAFAGGSFVARFEEEFAEYCQCQESIGVGSGTEALWLVLAALGIGTGDEVITVPNTFIATAEAISNCGAQPVFVDVDPTTYTLNPELLEAAITPRTKAIIPVHLYGQVADMDRLMDIATAHGLQVIEDACQAHGAEYKGRKAGSMGIAGCFSFYPGKNLGAYGDAGGIVTNDAGLATKLRSLRDHGQSRKYHHDYIGWNSRMDGLQAAILSVKLKHLSSWNESRRQHAAAYGRKLAGLQGIRLPEEADFAKHIYHVYAIHVQERARLMAALSAKGIQSAIHYPVPVHLQRAYQSLGLKRGLFPVAEKHADEQLSLPMFPELSEPQIDAVVETLAQFSN